MSDKAKPLDVQDLLEYARAAVAVLRALQISKTTMTYADFAQAIGLMEGPNTRWHVRHKHQNADVLYVVSAVEKKAGRREIPLDYASIVNRRTGRPGPGEARTSRIVVR